MLDLLQISSSAGDLLQLELLGELLVELLKLRHQLLAGSDDRLLWLDDAVCLHAQLEGREERVGNLVTGEEDVVRLDELCAEEVAEGVVLLVEGEHRSIWDTWWISAWHFISCYNCILTSLWLDLDFLLAISEYEGLVPWVLVSTGVDFGSDIAIQAWIGVGRVVVLDVQFVAAMNRVWTKAAIEGRHRISRHGGGLA